MKAKLLFGAGMAAGYVLGSRSGRAGYEKLKSRAAALWQSKPVQDQVAAAADAVKEKAPDVASQLTEAARRAGTVLGSAVRRDAGDSGAGEGESGTGDGKTGAASTAAAADVGSDPALSDETGQDWSGEGGATPAGAATNVDPDKVS